MHIVIFGAAGDVGSRIVAEALSRQHQVTAVVRDPAQFDSLPKQVIVRSGDAGNAQDVACLSDGQDVVISAIRPPAGQEDLLPDLTKSILDGVTKSKVRALIVGGAASLKLPGQKDHTVLTAPGFLPESVIPIAKACQVQYELCQAELHADWTYFSPAANLTPGTRSGAYRLGMDELVIDTDGVSAISMEDFAVAVLDEAEQARHHRTRVTAAY